jgi:hypothetical protein
MRERAAQLREGRNADGGRAPALALNGIQEPRISSAPACVSSRGREAVEFAAAAGLALDPWQERALEQSLGVRADGKWAAFEVGLNVPRQNGKGSILEARELVGLFEFGERLVIHSAHEFPTSLEAFRRLLFLIEDTPDLDRQVKRVSRSHGEEGIDLMNGNRIRFRTRTKGGGRGFSGDLLVFDEAMILQLMAVGALLPTLSARPNPQVWYAGSPVDQMVHDHGIVFARIRERGLRGDDPSLAYVEHSADPGVDADGEPVPLAQLDAALLASGEAWAQANPGLGIRISAEHVSNELRSMDARTFAVERLGIGDWPATHIVNGEVISADEWNALVDAQSKVLDPVCFAYDVKPDRSWASIGVAGLRPDGLRHVELVDRQKGTGWVASRLAELVGRHDAAAVVCDPYGPAGSLVHEIEELGVEVQTVTAQEHAIACGLDVRPGRAEGTAPPRSGGARGGDQGRDAPAARRCVGVVAEGRRRHLAARRRDARALGRDDRAAEAEPGAAGGVRMRARAAAAFIGRVALRAVPAPLDVALLVGVGLIGAGVAQIYGPAAYIVVGVLLIAGALRLAGVRPKGEQL